MHTGPLYVISRIFLAIDMNIIRGIILYTNGAINGHSLVKTHPSSHRN